MRDIINQACKIIGSGNEFRSFEEAFMTGKHTIFDSISFLKIAAIGAKQVYRLWAAVPDLESIPTRVLARENGYEIREAQVSGEGHVLDKIHLYASC